jgi:hypothetical protein
MDARESVSLGDEHKHNTASKDYPLLVFVPQQRRKNVTEVSDSSGRYSTRVSCYGFVPEGRAWMAILQMGLVNHHHPDRHQQTHVQYIP